jgi:hypothetical protein
VNKEYYYILYGLTENILQDCWGLGIGLTTPTENILQDCWGLGIGLTTPTENILQDSWGLGVGLTTPIKIIDIIWLNRKMILQNCWGLGVELTTPPRLKNIVTKSEEVKTELICQGRHQEGRPQRRRMGTTS